ncbi:MAG: preprotein translocase subunit SecY [Coriobacteriia bacterium]|nr:preprotein translocase subunit SecY [Coriobacteriia bacterium]
MFAAIANAFRVPDLRKKIMFTLFILVLYRIGAHVPVPGVNATSIQATLDNLPALGMLNLFSGNALAQFSVFSLGVMPYITASIIMQLLQAAIPALERLKKEGEAGQQKITQYTRYLTVFIATVEAIGFIGMIFAGAIDYSGGLPRWFSMAVVVVTLVAGTTLIMWLAELITQRGIGNGMSLLIFASIISGFPAALASSLMFGNDGALGNALMVTLIIAVVLAVIMVVIYIDRGQRRIPVNYAKRVVGRRVMGGTSTYIPLKVNGANVIPIIFASAILSIPMQLALVINTPWFQSFANAISSGPLNWIVTFILIVFFSYFYTALIFNPIELSDNLRQQGGFIPGVRPGQKTVEYIQTVMNRIVLPGALFLGTIAVGTSILFSVTNNPLIQQFGGTSILIMVGVALETMTQIESQLKMRHYDGFFK